MKMDWLRARAQATPHNLALIFEDKRWTYADLDGLVDGLATSLDDEGIRPGDFVGALLPNSLEYVCLVHGLARLGAVLIPLNSRLTAGELQWQLGHIGCKWLVHGRETAAEAQHLHAVNLQLSIVNCDLSSARPVERMHSQHRFELETLQAIVFTSGTTGRPKGAMLTFANHFWSATASAFRLGTQQDDLWLSCLPLYHVGGLAVILRSCLYGTTVLLQRGCDVTSLNEALDGHEVTLVSLVPTMLYRLLDARPAGSWPSSLRLALLGGAAASADLIERCRRHGVPVAVSYGLTESGSQVATMLPKDVLLKPGSVGKPLMFTSVRITDEEGETVPQGQYGEVVISGKSVMVGYVNDHDGTARALRDGELFTGDIGYLDQDGDLWLVRRRSDVIVSGGENVYPAEVEAVMRQHSAVAAACVVGVENAEWGQQVSAMVVLGDGATVDEQELVQFCRERLAAYKLPRQVRFIDRLPQTASGKIARRVVAEKMGHALAAMMSE